MSNSGASQPAGWYYAAGDPPGTHRYWDGVQWQGGPQTIGGGAGNAPVPAQAPAGAGQRFLAFLIDIGLFVGLVVGAVGLGEAGLTVSDSVGETVLVIGVIGAFVFAIYNFLYRHATTGQSVGKKKLNIKLVADDTGEPAGFGKILLRGLVIWVINSVFRLDDFSILFDKNNQRLSDNALKLRVLKV